MKDYSICPECGKTGLTRADYNTKRRECKQCSVKIVMQWKAANPDKVRASARQFAARHPEAHANWQRENPDRVKANNAAYKAKLDKSKKSAIIVSVLED